MRDAAIIRIRASIDRCKKPARMLVLISISQQGSLIRIGCKLLICARRRLQARHGRPWPRRQHYLIHERSRISGTAHCKCTRARIRSPADSGQALNTRRLIASKRVARLRKRRRHCCERLQCRSRLSRARGRRMRHPERGRRIMPPHRAHARCCHRCGARRDRSARLRGPTASSSDNTGCRAPRGAHAVYGAFELHPRLR